jgi:hypothetical protein
MASDDDVRRWSGASSMARSRFWRPSAPAYVSSNYGPEFIAYAVVDWCRFNGGGTIFTDPGLPPGRALESRASAAAYGTSC